MIRTVCSLASIATVLLTAVLAQSEPAQAKRVCVRNDYSGGAWQNYTAWGQTRKQARTAAGRTWVRRVRAVHGFQYTRLGLAKNKRYFCSRCRKTASTITTCRNITRNKLGYQTGYYCLLTARPCVRK